MIAARLHTVGQPMRFDEIPIPEPRPTDVLVEVQACGIVPNLIKVIANVYGQGMTENKVLPSLPAIFGLDATGIVNKVGNLVRSVRPGDRVYINPARTCGSCLMCRTARPMQCPSFSYQGYMGRSREVMAAYPYGGLCQYVTAPQDSLIVLPENVSFENAARFGYLGTAYSAAKSVGVGPGRSVLINGVSGMLGLNAAMSALALGASKILGTGRNQELLNRVKALAPNRISVLPLKAQEMTANIADDPLFAWVKSETDGYGADMMIDCLPPGAPPETMLRGIYSLCRGGRAVSIGAVLDRLSLDIAWMGTNRVGLAGSTWFTTAEGQEMTALVSAGVLDMSVLEHRTYPLGQINEALASMDNRSGGFTNFVVHSSRLA